MTIIHVSSTLFGVALWFGVYQERKWRERK